MYEANSKRATLLRDVRKIRHIFRFILNVGAIIFYTAQNIFMIEIIINIIVQVHIKE